MRKAAEAFTGGFLTTMGAAVAIAVLIELIGRYPANNGKLIRENFRTETQ